MKKVYVVLTLLLAFLLFNTNVYAETVISQMKLKNEAIVKYDDCDPEDPMDYYSKSGCMCKYTFKPGDGKTYSACIGVDKDESSHLSIKFHENKDATGNFSRRDNLNDYFPSLNPNNIEKCPNIFYEVGEGKFDLKTLKIVTGNCYIGAKKQSSGDSLYTYTAEFNDTGSSDFVGKLANKYDDYKKLEYVDTKEECEWKAQTIQKSNVTYSTNPDKGTCVICYNNGKPTKIVWGGEWSSEYPIPPADISSLICNTSSNNIYSDIKTKSDCEAKLADLQKTDEGGSGGGDQGGDGGGQGGTTKTEFVSCGNGTLKVPKRIVSIVSTIIKIIQIIVPVILIILGMIDFGKATISQKEDEINKGKKVFFTRLITALLVFLVILIVKIAVGFVNEANENTKIVSCIDCFINEECK